MPDTISRKEVEFLREVDHLASEGMELQDIARKKGIAPGTLTYRLNRRGLTAVVKTRIVRLVDRRTGRSLDELLEAGELLVVPDAKPEPVPA